MLIRKLAVWVALGALMASCDRPAEKPATDSSADETAADQKAADDESSSQKSLEEKNRQLEQRVAELEQRLTSQSPAPEARATAQRPARPAPAAPAAQPRPVHRDTPPPLSTPEREKPEKPQPPPRAADRDVEREPAPARALTLPADTELTLVLESGLSSETSQEGDRVVARVERATSEDGRVLLPGGTLLEGRVTEAVPSGKVKGRARLAVRFDRIVVRGQSHPLDTTDIEVEADSEGKRDAVIIGGSTAAGAVLGAIVKGGSGAKKGAVVGAAGGAAAVLLTKGKDIEIPSGSRWVVKVQRTTRLG